MDPVGVQVNSDIDPVSGHQNGKVFVDHSNHNGKPLGSNGKALESEAKDASERGTESGSEEDSHDPSENHQIVTDERNGLGHDHEAEEDDEDDDEEQEVEEEAEIDHEEEEEPDEVETTDPQMDDHDDYEEMKGVEQSEMSEAEEDLYIPTESQYVSLCVQVMQVQREKELMEQQLAAFKQNIASRLIAVRDSTRDSTQSSASKLKNLQNKYNQAMQDKRRLQRERDKALKEIKDSGRESKRMHSRINQLTQEVQKKGECR